jgi:hypothetical protein
LLDDVLAIRIDVVIDEGDSYAVGEVSAEYGCDGLRISSPSIVIE